MIKNNLSKKFLIVLIALLSLSLLSACQDKSETNTKAKKTLSILTVNLKDDAKVLPYNGIIEPINVTAVTSPVEGTITKKHFIYGSTVKKGQVLAVLHSPSFDKSFRSAIATYLTSKEKYNTNKQTITGNRDLYKNGIISLQQLQTAESGLNDAYLSYIQAEHALLEILKKVGLSEESFLLIKIGDAKEVQNILQQPISHIKIKANADGIALLPTKSDSSSSSAGNSKITVGSQVKAGQMILALGDMSGIKINFDVDEVNINQIDIGDKAIVTSSAFPGIKLHGRVVSVSSQAKSGITGGLPSFPVVVAVDKINAAEQKVIHVGMSAKVQLQLIANKTIVIPIKAVFQKNGLSYVKIQTGESNTVKDQLVKTGSTTLSGVQILEGLKPGDKIVLGH